MDATYLMDGAAAVDWRDRESGRGRAPGNVKGRMDMLIDELQSDERFRDLNPDRGMPMSWDSSRLTEREKETIISELESIDDPEEKKRAILGIPDDKFRKDMIAVYIRLFRPLPEERPLPEPDGDVYISWQTPDGKTFSEKATVEQWREAKRAQILSIPDRHKRQEAMLENIELFKHRG